MKTSRDKDLLKAKASVSALLEMKDQNVNDFFDELLNDKSIDPMIKEDILREKLI
jgi:bilin biosynthesis protein